MEFDIGLEADFYGVDCNSFKLDNCVFEAVEDESDGYRSCMAEVRMKDDIKGLIFFQTPLARIRVEERSEGRYNHEFEGYNLVDVNDGFVWLTFGADDPHDYYPSFEFFYQHKHEYVLSKFES